MELIKPQQYLRQKPPPLHPREPAEVTTVCLVGSFHTAPGPPGGGSLPTSAHPTAPTSPTHNTNAPLARHRHLHDGTWVVRNGGLLHIPALLPEAGGSGSPVARRYPPARPALSFPLAPSALKGPPEEILAQVTGRVQQTAKAFHQLVADEKMHAEVSSRTAIPHDKVANPPLRRSILAPQPQPAQATPSKMLPAAVIPTQVCATPSIESCEGEVEAEAETVEKVSASESEECGKLVVVEEVSAPAVPVEVVPPEQVVVQGVSPVRKKRRASKNRARTARSPGGAPTSVHRIPTSRGGSASMREKATAAAFAATANITGTGRILYALNATRPSSACISDDTFSALGEGVLQNQEARDVILAQDSGSHCLQSYMYDSASADCCSQSRDGDSYKKAKSCQASKPRTPNSQPPLAVCNSLAKDEGLNPENLKTVQKHIERLERHDPGTVEVENTPPARVESAGSLPSYLPAARPLKAKKQSFRKEKKERKRSSVTIGLIPQQGKVGDTPTAPTPPPAPIEPPPTVDSGEFVQSLVEDAASLHPFSPVPLDSDTLPNEGQDGPPSEAESITISEPHNICSDAAPNEEASVSEHNASTSSHIKNTIQANTQPEEIQEIQEIEEKQPEEILKRSESASPETENTNIPEAIEGEQPQNVESPKEMPIEAEVEETHHPAEPTLHTPDPIETDAPPHPETPQIPPKASAREAREDLPLPSSLRLDQQDNQQDTPMACTLSEDDMFSAVAALHTSVGKGYVEEEPENLPLTKRKSSKKKKKKSEDQEWNPEAQGAPPEAVLSASGSPLSTTPRTRKAKVVLRSPGEAPLSDASPAFTFNNPESDPALNEEDDTAPDKNIKGILRRKTDTVTALNDSLGVVKERRRHSVVSPAGRRASHVVRRSSHCVRPAEDPTHRAKETIRKMSTRRGSVEVPVSFNKGKDWKRKASLGFARFGATNQKPLPRKLWHDLEEGTETANFLTYNKEDDVFMNTGPKEEVLKLQKYLKQRKQTHCHALILSLSEYDDNGVGDLELSKMDTAALTAALGSAKYSFDILDNSQASFLQPTRDNFVRMLHHCLNGVKRIDQSMTPAELDAVAGAASGTGNNTASGATRIAESLNSTFLDRTQPLLIIINARGAMGFDGNFSHLLTTGNTSSRFAFTKEKTMHKNESNAGIIPLVSLTKKKDALGRKPLVICDIWKLPVRGAKVNKQSFAFIAGFESAAGEMDALYNEVSEGGGLLYYFTKALMGKAARASIVTPCNICSYVAERLSRQKAQTFTEANSLTPGNRIILDREISTAVRKQHKSWIVCSRWQKCRFFTTMEIAVAHSSNLAETSVAARHSTMPLRIMFAREIYKLLYRTTKPLNETHIDGVKLVSCREHREVRLYLNEAVNDNGMSSEDWIHALLCFLIENYTPEKPVPEKKTEEDIELENLKKAVGDDGFRRRKPKKVPFFLNQKNFAKFIQVTRRRSAPYLTLQYCDDRIVRLLHEATKARRCLAGHPLEAAVVLCDMSLTGCVRDASKFTKIIRFNSLKKHRVTLLTVVSEAREKEFLHVAATTIQAKWKQFYVRKRVLALRHVLSTQHATYEDLISHEQHDREMLFMFRSSGKVDVVIAYEEEERGNLYEWQHEDRMLLWQRFVNGTAKLLSSRDMDEIRRILFLHFFGTVEDDNIFNLHSLELPKKKKPDEKPKIGKQYIRRVATMLHPMHKGNSTPKGNQFYSQAIEAPAVFNSAQGIEAYAQTNHVLQIAIFHKLQLMHTYNITSVLRTEALIRQQIWGRFSILQDEYCGRLNFHRRAQMPIEGVAANDNTLVHSVRLHKSYRPLRPVVSATETRLQSECASLSAEETTERQCLMQDEDQTFCALEEKTQWVRAELLRVHKEGEKKRGSYEEQRNSFSVTMMRHHSVAEETPPEPGPEDVMSERMQAILEDGYYAAKKVRELRKFSGPGSRRASIIPVPPIDKSLEEAKRKSDTVARILHESRRGSLAAEIVGRLAADPYEAVVGNPPEDFDEGVVDESGKALFAEHVCLMIF